MFLSLAARFLVLIFTAVPSLTLVWLARQSLEQMPGVCSADVLASRTKFDARPASETRVKKYDWLWLRRHR